MTRMIIPKKKTAIFLVLTVLLSVYFVKDCHAGAVVLDSMGVVSSGRGGANITHADNGIVIHDNPAALVNMPAGKRIEATIEFIYPEVKYEDPLDFDYSKHEIITIPTFSFTYKGHEDSRFAFGVGVFAPAGFGTEYHLEHSAKGFLTSKNVSFGNQLYKSEASLIKLLFSASYKVNKKLSVGFSIGPSFQSLTLEMPYTFQTGRFAGLSAIADIKGDDSFGLSYTAGVQYKISEKTVLGLSFISESKATLRGDGDIIVPVFSLLTRLLPNREGEYDVKANFEWPREIGFGISHKLNESHRFSAEIVWFNWASAFDRFDLELTDGNNRAFNLLLGPVINDILPLSWENVLAYRFGYEYFFNGRSDDVFRFGYIFNENPVPDSTLTPLIPGTLKHNFTIGYGHKWEKLEFNIASQFSIGDPEFVDTSEIVGGDFDNSSVKTKTYLLHLGLTYKF
ncbi:MAG: OmpP1/FadL family transporter [Candidatus Anammoxibacter sp.]